MFSHKTRTSQTGKTSMHWYTEIFYAALLLPQGSNDRTGQHKKRNSAFFIIYKYLLNKI